MKKIISWRKIRSKDELEKAYRRCIPFIRKLARECGYAIGVHGSLRRDLDLIAVPWAEKFVSPDELASRIQEECCGQKFNDLFDWETKPNGRKATVFPIGLNAFVDLSVVPFMN
jgi:hypothetical protein